MATSGIYDGSQMRLYVDDGAGGSKIAIGYAQNCSISLSAEEVSITHKDNDGSGVWQDTEPKTLSGSISFEAYWSQTTIGSSTKLYDDLFTYFSNRTKIAWAVKTATSGDWQMVGYGYITSLEGSAADKEEATFSGTISIAGQVTQLYIT